MSMNFYISGKREITVSKTGSLEMQHCNYQPWQTPTIVTKKILASSAPVEEYKSWVMSFAKDEYEVIFGDDDIFCDMEPIGSKIVNASKDECAQVDSWIAAVTALGYDLEFYTL